MLDIRKIVKILNSITLKHKKGSSIDLMSVLAIDEKRRTLLTEVEKLKSERNAESKRIGEAKRGENADEAVQAMRVLGDKIAALDNEMKELDNEQTEKLMHIPNVPHSSTPEGKDSSDNVVQSSWGTPRAFF